MLSVKATLWLAIGFISSMSLASLAGETSFALDTLWLNEDIVAEESQTPLEQKLGSQCTTHNVVIASLSKLQEVCIYDTGVFRYGTFTYAQKQWFGGYSYTPYFVVGAHDAFIMYTVEGLPTGWQYFGVGADLYAKTSLSNGTLVRIDNLLTKLQRRSILQRDTDHTLLPDSYHTVLKKPDGSAAIIRGVDQSSDARWLLVEVLGGGYVRVDTQTQEMRWVSTFYHQYGFGTDAQVQFAVANTGRVVAVGGLNVQSMVLLIDDTCGKQITAFPNAIHDKVQLDRELPNQCPEVDIRSVVQDKLGDDTLRDIYSQSITDDGGQLAIRATLPLYSIGRWFRLHPASYQPPSLQYLALGDSFSSGEGDVGYDDQYGEKYYREGTDVKGGGGVPREQCHISTRSYPYLLASDMGLGAPGTVNNTQWQDVACSGAWATKDYMTGDNYLGQDDRLQDNRSIKQLQTDALIRYLPGRVQQFSYISRDKPAVITLTAGGNDIGFGDILTACARPGTCDYALGDKKTVALASTIVGMRSKLARLYTSIHTASPTSKIFVLGYPQIMSSQPSSCVLGATFNAQEREYVRQGATYLNNVIQAAAADAGVRYVNVENAFGDHVLCGKGELYVNSIDLTNCLLGENDPLYDHACVESFHPNDLGHKALQASVASDVGRDLRVYEYCPADATSCPATAQHSVETPSLFAEALTNYVVGDDPPDRYEYTKVTDSTYVRTNGTGGMSIHYENLEPESVVTIIAYSEPTLLGTFTTDKNGVLNVVVPVPDALPIGVHTLYLEAIAPLGEPVTLWQTIQIVGGKDDANRNGIADSDEADLLASNNHATGKEPHVQGAPADTQQITAQGRQDLARSAATLKPNATSTVVTGGDINARLAGWVAAHRRPTFWIYATITAILLSISIWLVRKRKQ